MFVLVHCVSVCLRRPRPTCFHSCKMPPRKKQCVDGRPPTGPRPPARACVFPEGPKSAADLQNWPSDMLERSVGAAEVDEAAAMRRLRMRRWLHNCNLQLTSDYSGFECFRESLRCGYQACGQHFKDWKILSPRWERSCDIDPCAQDILVWYSNEFDHGESCVLPDLNARLDADAVAKLDELEPPKEASLETKVANRKSQEEYIQSNKEVLFHAGSTSPCLVHGCGCFTMPRSNLGSDEGAISLRVNTAGTCCQGWSAEGKQERQGHISERAHAIWIGEREQMAKIQLEDAFVQECTVFYPWIQKIKQPLENTHKCVRIKTSPVLIAVPSNRPRSLVTGLSLATLVWVGPEDDDEVQREFDEIFRRRCVATADVFLNAGEDEINNEMRRLALVQGHCWPDDFNVLDAIFLEETTDIMLQCLPPGGFSRYRDWEKKRKLKGGDCFLADCHHNVHSKGPQCGSVFPCELRATTVVAHHLGRMVTPYEQLAAHGWHMHDVPGSQWPVSPVRKYFDKLSKGAIGRLAGNGISLPVAWCVWLYMLGNIAAREQPRVSHAEAALIRDKDSEEDLFEDLDKDSEEDRFEGWDDDLFA